MVVVIIAVAAGAVVVATVAAAVAAVAAVAVALVGLRLVDYWFGALLMITKNQHFLRNSPNRLSVQYGIKDANDTPKKCKEPLRG